MTILPTLLYNAETWVGINKESMNKLEDIQLFFLRLATEHYKGSIKVRNGNDEHEDEGVEEETGVHPSCQEIKGW